MHEGQHVKAGQVLFTLDPLPFQIALDNAKANLGQTVQGIDRGDSGLRDGRSAISMPSRRRSISTSAPTIAMPRWRRQNAIAAAGTITARLTLPASQQHWPSLQQTAQPQLAKLNGNPNIAAEQTPEYQKAKATVDEDQRQLDHAAVRAPFDGMVGEVDSLQPGTLVISALSAFTTTSAVGLIGKNVWIEADMKETDLTHVHPGAPVDITVDTYPGCKWNGHVDA